MTKKRKPIAIVIGTGDNFQLTMIVRDLVSSDTSNLTVKGPSHEQIIGQVPMMKKLHDRKMLERVERDSEVDDTGLTIVAEYFLTAPSVSSETSASSDQPPEDNSTPSSESQGGNGGSTGEEKPEVKRKGRGSRS